MLASARAIRTEAGPLSRTPWLVPSFSSKGFPEVEEIVQFSSEVIDGPALVSAYDIAHGYITPPFHFPSVLFLDSGGYEASKDTDLSELPHYEHQPKEWSAELHQKVIDVYEPTVPTVFISFDHPRERISFADQVRRAQEMRLPAGGIREILLKPETDRQRFLDMPSLLAQIHKLADFAVIGVTEKEIGSSMLERMVNIAKLRHALTAIGLDTPIHVFGSLDTISSPLYFLSGADIFDGLTWLRFAYMDGLTIYKHNFGAAKLGLTLKAHLVEARCWSSNYYYLSELQLELHRFLVTEDFRSFTKNGELFEKGWQNLRAAIGG